ncbi:MAG: hypothetical protein DRQ55_10125 [Planctomycetota bacterium]|nr:MAG: hypothetical protein DRQ55_10125 [Planctomycetota bacterium]
MRTAKLMGLLLCLAACGLFGPPRWVDKPPLDDEYIYGVGLAGPNSSANPQRARELAFERAVAYLGRAIRVQVTSSSVIVDTNRWTDYQAESIQFSDEDLAGVELLEVWTDEVRGGQPHRTYVLVRMPRSQAEGIAARLGP